MMNYWLLKTEPDEYSYGDLEEAGRDTWDGVANNLALKHMRNMKVGDQAFIYHTGKERAVIGVAGVVREAYPDPDADQERLIIIDVAARHWLPRPVTLAEIKADPAFADWDLVRNSRLSAMAVPPKLWERILAMAAAE